MIKKGGSSMLNFNPTDYDKLPDIDLYMDQVLSYFEKTLKVFRIHDEDKILTKTMINNYVKAGMIEKPDKKKYDQDRLANLIMIYFLKNVVSMQTIEQLADPDLSTQEQYARFNKVQRQVFEETEKMLSKKEADQELALELLIKADIYKRLAEKIVKEL
jgi:hypothetical protein